jgi:hypothetical protein
MEQQEKPANEEEKQNQEEEEFDEEDEEEKEGDKKRHEKEENKKESKNDNKEQQNDKIDENEAESEKNKDKNEIISQKVEEIKENKEENKIQEKIENNNDLPNNEKNNEKIENKNIIDQEKKEEENNNEEEQEESSSSYILKYVRKSNEPRESAYDKELIKSKKCLYMIEFKILKGKTEKYLLVYCHEIAAIYFDEIYEKKYSIKDLYKENRHFRIFDDVEEAKNIIDEIMNNNPTNNKKIYIDCQDNIFKLHLKISFFDKENEVILNIPKKDITDKERIRLLPEFLKEIQIKMNSLEEDNKKLKSEYKNMGENALSGNLGESDEFFGEKDKKSKSGKGSKKKIVKK